jgi:hypothetical protein
MFVRYIVPVVDIIAASVLQVTLAKSLRGLDTKERGLQSTRIVGGEGSSSDEFPFFVDLDGCGASLIWEDVILTGMATIIVKSCAWGQKAVLALNDANTHKPSLSVPSSNVLEAAHCNGGGIAKVGPSKASHSITSGTVHPNYNPNTNSFDIMVMKLGSPALGVPTIGLNSNSGSPSNGEQMQVIGLGLTEEEGEEADGLRKVTVNSIERAKCNELYEGEIDDSMLYVSIDISGPMYWLVICII